VEGLTTDVSIRGGTVVPSALALVGDRLDVPLVQGGTAPYVDFDVAASAPCLAAVREAVDDFLPSYASVHRGAGWKSKVSTAAYEWARQVVAGFVGARSDDTVVFTRNTTDALNLLASALPADAEVVVFSTEHHANLLPWARRRRIVLAPPADPAAAVAAIEAALSVPGSPHRLVAVTGASNVTGELWPVAEIAAVVRRHGARIVVDAAQLAPHHRIDLAALGVDWVALSGHKLYAPFGAGALIGRREWLEDAPPYLDGGGAVRFVTADDAAWGDLPDRHEAGSPNVVGAVALAAACQALASVGMEALAERERRLAAHATARLAEVPGLIRYRLWDETHPAIGVLTFNVGDLHYGLVAAALSAEHAIGVRHGCFCAHPLMARLLGVHPDVPPRVLARFRDGERVAVPGAVRASLGLGATEDDVDRLADALVAFADHGPRWSYRPASGPADLVPDPDPRPVPAFVAACAGGAAVGAPGPWAAPRVPGSGSPAPTSSEGAVRS
jgi:selenocysteine lyase/cysteine desulfurase